VTQRTAYLLVTCCLEDSRAEILKQVVENLQEQATDYIPELTVFDNASTVKWVPEYLTQNFPIVYRSSRNVGYWSAVNWWLRQQAQRPERPALTYIIESDMIHYDMQRIEGCEKFLMSNHDVGSVRLHEYSVEDMHLYNKSAPVQGSKKNVWQSHVNSVTGKPIVNKPADLDAGIWTNNFLTQLPALNRFESMLMVFDRLLEIGSFKEPDFQRIYWDLHPKTAILDGGIFHFDPGCHTSGVVTGSWTNPETLRKLGYYGTRIATIEFDDCFQVQRL